MRYRINCKKTAGTAKEHRQKTGRERFALTFNAKYYEKKSGHAAGFTLIKFKESE